MKYSVVLEPVKNGAWGAYPIDMSGVVVVADTISEALESVNQAIEMQLEALAEDGCTPPTPVTPPLHTVDLAHVSGFAFLHEMPEGWVQAG